MKNKSEKEAEKGKSFFKSIQQWGSVTHQMAVLVLHISCCVLNHHNLFYQIQNALAFNWDTCCHLAPCLQLLPFHCCSYKELTKNLLTLVESATIDLNSTNSSFDHYRFCILFEQFGHILLICLHLPPLFPWEIHNYFSPSFLSSHPNLNKHSKTLINVKKYNGIKTFNQTINY